MSTSTTEPAPRPFLQGGPPRDKPLRIALVVAGAVSLGSYEAGALTALIKLVAGSNGEIIIDTIVGASAGSITGLLLAHALLKGKGVEDQQTLWVDKTDMDILLKGGSIDGRPRGPLSPKDLLAWASGQLAAGDGPIQEGEIYLVMSIANLRGLTYRMAMHGRDEAVRADTYRDAKVFVMTSASSREDWLQAMNVAAASSAHAFAFSAVRLDRHKQEYPPEIDWPDGTVSFWYTDGGTVYNEPFGMALDAVYSPRDLSPELEEDRGMKDTDRLFLLIHPHPDDPLSPWPPGGHEPLFMQSSLRAFTMQRAQSLYQDLLKLEKYNGRVQWRLRLEKAMLDANLDEEDWVKNLANEVRQDREMRHQKTKGEEPAEGGTPPHPVKSDLATILDASTGTAGKRAAYVEVVGPDLDPRVRAGEKKIAELLAGERLGHFLGFTAEDARKSDFRLGYENFTTWWQGDATLQGFRTKTGFDSLDIAQHECLQWAWRGEFSLGQVPRGKRLRWAFVLFRRYFREVRAQMTRAR
jgi:hypothetical protein